MVLLLLVALLIGGLIGYFIPRGGDDIAAEEGVDTTAEGRVDYGCALALDLKGTNFDQYAFDDPVMTDISSISMLLGGYMPTRALGIPRTEELGQQLYRDLMQVEMERMTETMDEIVALCEAR